MNLRAAAGLGLLACLCACAKAPESIAPAYVSDLPYRSYSCQTLGEEQARVSNALAVASAQQEKARSNDTVGVIFLGLPVSTLSGDNVAPEVARLKGEQDALQRAANLKACGTPREVPEPKGRRA
jgi:hypothetical protein